MNLKINLIKHYREGVTVRPVHLRRRGRRQPERRGRSGVPLSHSKNHYFIKRNIFKMKKETVPR